MTEQALATVVVSALEQTRGVTDQDRAEINGLGQQELANLRARLEAELARREARRIEQERERKQTLEAVLASTPKPANHCDMDAMNAWRARTEAWWAEQDEINRKGE